MVALVWDAAGTRMYETGVEKGVVYPMDPLGDYPLGHAWNGLVSCTLAPSGAEPTALYADNIKYLNLISAEELSATIEAYMYPDEFGLLDGSGEPEVGVVVGQQSRGSFGLAFVTKVGNDVDGDAHGYKINLLYGCKVSPSEKAYQSINDSPETVTFSWEISTTPEVVTYVAGYTPSANLVIDSRTADPTNLALLEAQLFGDAVTDPNMLHIDQVIELISTGSYS